MKPAEALRNARIRGQMQEQFVAEHTRLNHRIVSREDFRQAFCVTCRYLGTFADDDIHEEAVEPLMDG